MDAEPPSESPDQFQEQLLRAGKRRRRALVGVACLGLFGIFVLYAPGWALERAQNSHTACSNRDYEDRPQADETCDSSGWLLLPKLVPWKQKAALEREISIQRSVASRALKLATSFRPDAAARARAADAAAAVYKRERDDPTAPAAEGLLSLLALEGDARAIVRHSSVARTAPALNNVMRALLYSGDLEAAIAFTERLPPLEKEDYSARELYLTTGVLSCLGKARDDGAESLLHAERIHAQFHTFPYYEARIARAACGQHVEPKNDDLDRDALLSFSLGSTLTGKALDDRLIGRADTMIRAESTTPFVVAALLGRERTLDETIALLAAIPRVPWLGMAPLPWSSRIASTSVLSSYPLLLDPERHQEAAEKLEQLASSAPKAGPSPEEIEKTARQLPVHVKKSYSALREDPRAVLRHYARGFWLEAASAWSAQGHGERVERAANRAQKLSPTAETAVLAAPSLIGAGRFAAAGALLSSATDRAEASASTRAMFFSFQAQVFAHFQRWKEAKEAVEHGLEIAETLASDLSLPVALGLHWLGHALAILSGDTSRLPAISTPEIYERDARAWSDLLLLPEPERATLRWRMRTVDVGSLPITLPAQLFVIGEAARGHDIEVWLDHALGLFDRRFAGAPALRARAEAARFRGEVELEADYLARAAKLEKHFSDPKSRALGALLGL